VRICCLLLALLLAACAEQPRKVETPAPPPSAPAKEVVKPTAAAACNCEPSDTLPPLQIPDVPRYAPRPVAEQPLASPKSTTLAYAQLSPVDWSSVEGFAQDDLAAAWGALKQSCSVLKKRDAWQAACAAIEQPAPATDQALRALLLTHFTPYQVSNPDGSVSGMITGYYEPMLNGSRTRTERYRYPLYSQPEDLISVDLAGLYPELANKRVRGRLAGNKLTPYFNRGEIEVVPSPLAGKELLWVDDIIDLFFLQIQGSGYIQLENGEGVHVGYADQNGHTYLSIGRVLISQGELTADQASMQGIKNWARNHSDKLRTLLNANPSYVFFRELPPGLSGPLGALGVPIAAERSIAIDPRYIPLGAPVFLSTTYPNSNKPLQRLMLAQDTGGAIKGAVRADFFWGAGVEAGRQAGAMKQQGKLWVLLPRILIIDNGKAQ
jgi:membrane-bound lytic murein transglycosylase A